MLKKHDPLFFAITMLGISSVITQISITRELLNLFEGSEFVLGITLSCWLLLTGLGAWLGRFVKPHIRLLTGALSLVALLPMGHLLLIRSLRNVIAVAGGAVDLRVLLTWLPLLLIPYCVLSGGLLTLATMLFERKYPDIGLGRVYFLDNIGDILGGALFSFVLIYVTTTFNALWIPAALNAIAGLWVAVHASGGKLIAAPIAAGLVLIAGAFLNLDDRSRSWLFPAQKVIAWGESPYGAYAVTRDAEQVNLYENGIPLHSSTNVLEAEETVHFAMAQFRASQAKVLLLSGGVTGSLEQILKYSVSRIDYVELDPELIQVARRFNLLPDDRKINIHTQDARKFLASAAQEYDVILADLPPPSNVQINRFYTREFFDLVRARLTPHGVFSFSLPGAENYYDASLSRLLRTTWATLKTAFEHLAAFPGSQTIFVASPRKVTKDIARRLEYLQIDNAYLNRYYLSARLTEDRLELLQQQLSGDAEINRDLHPIAFRQQVAYLFSHFNLNINWLLAAFGIAALCCIFAYRPTETVLLTTGFGSVSIELVILMLIQIHSGYVYLKFGLTITLFMTGLAVGSFGANRFVAQERGKSVYRSALLVLEGISVAGCGALLLIVGHTQIWRSELLLYICVGASAVLTGAQFPLAGQASTDAQGTRASKLYTADFLGSGLGSFLAAILLIPALGVAAALAVAGGLKTVSMTKLWISK
ncbi:MAG: hypothetical protein GF398_06500 [Chitinivibrionales bacterium]|nr:hypothetical protein [Chitinivibrionales bacterium]